MSRPTVSLREYGDRITLAALAAKVRVEPEQLGGELNRWRRRAKSRIGLDPVSTTLRGIRFEGAAGVAALRSASLEVSPKFSHGDGWAADLAALVAVSRTAKAMTAALPTASHRRNLAVPSLMSLLLLAELRTAARRRGPIRRYEELRWLGWELEGEFDAVDLVDLRPDGVPQRRTDLTTRNPENALLSAALSALHDRVNESGLRERLRTASFGLGPQGPVISRDRRLPVQYRVYRDAVELAEVVLRDGGVLPGGHSGRSIGLMLPMVAEWERFVDRLLRWSLTEGELAGSSLELATKPGSMLTEDGRKTEPDGVLLRDGVPIAVVDAKYKRPKDGSAQQTTSGDLYQAIAFMESTSTDRVMLVHPSALPVGQVAELDHARMLSNPPRTVRAVGLGLAGLAQAEGPRKVASALAIRVGTWLAEPAH